ncbi:splicing factor 3B subunit 1-like [Dorcoceras hygrometricum]|uniref:Splicing factor 3B subunit 1-like n=1 Tax=Dorcoceras hygrometricum TaxID=472368 RepID=A0A2Z7ALU1_9LAMI|nr:splicing factor 3B subunit 1-like [Dorcoceras hygrometricum]
MASALINNASQIYFDSVLGKEDEGMVKMFKALASSGLRGFLGCPSAIYEAALVEFFQNASMRDVKFVSTVQGKAVEIFEEFFAGTFEFPTEGLTEMSDVPKDLVFDARTAFSFNVQQLKISCKKREMKFEFHFLNDILAKTVMVKAGYGDSRDEESHRICGADLYLVEGCADLELEDSKEFPPLKILTAKTVGTYMAKNKNITVDVDEPAGDEPVVKKKAASKKRPAPTVGEPAAKKKRTTVGKASPSDKNLALVTVAQDIEPISTVPDVTPRAPRRRALKRKLILPTGSNDEKDFGDAVEKERETTIVDEVDNIIGQIIAETEQIETDLEEPEIMISIEIDIEGYEHSIAVNDEDDNLDGAENEIARKMASFTASEQFLKEPLRSGEDNDMSGFKQPSKINETEEPDVVEPVVVEVTETAKNKETDIEPVETEKEREQETALMDQKEPTKIKFGLGIEIPGVKEGDWYKASLPQIAVTDKGKVPLVEKDEIKGHPALEMFSLICADIEFLVQLREKVIDEIVSFFFSFSLCRLTTIDLQILDMLSDAHLVALEKFKEQMRANNMEWQRLVSSRLFEGAERDRGAIIDRSNTNT